MGVRIRRAEASDRDHVVGLLDASFRDDPVSSWVFPGEEHRRARHAGLMGVFTDVTYEEGFIDLAEDGTAVALWLDVPAGPPPAEDGTDEAVLVREAVDPDNERVEQIARWTAEIHPAGRAHVYLWMIGVAPDRQGEGLGTALMAPVLERCDREGLPAYLEASNARSRALYERLGFVFTGTALDLPGGPSMWPMWREPQAGPRE
ncbi:GNAT family N-acetyltransferase [Streptomyces sp. SID5785]|uniref:GNAT family N-acetyltransferase n=1 Tax=Streptomyces sp. SID5785 TaxID=2690309 RepID=UPI001361AEA1|nr:GNAT family N-acetyltransferase [Streptomyces sp. SID5785]MZD07285.1 GNAT family N-acetyltransferase [Streptomyces sp. SID5785]